MSPCSPRSAVEESVELVGFSVGGLAPSLALQSDIIAAVIAQEGREDLRPVAAAGPDLDHGRFRRDAKEGQLLKRMARFVPCNEFRAPRRIADRGVERQISRGGRRTNSERNERGSSQTSTPPDGRPQARATRQLQLDGMNFIALRNRRRTERRAPRKPRSATLASRPRFLQGVARGRLSGVLAAKPSFGGREGVSLLRLRRWSSPERPRPSKPSPVRLTGTSRARCRIRPRTRP